MGRSNDRSPTPPIRERRTSRNRSENYNERGNPDRSHRMRTRSPRRDEYSRPPEPIEPYCRALCVSSLHPKASDDHIKDILYKEFRRYDATDIKIQHESGERVAYVRFRNCEDARDAKDSKSHITVYDQVTVIEKAYEVSKPRRPRYRDRSPEPPSHFRQPDSCDHRRPSSSYFGPKKFDRRVHPPGHHHSFPKPPMYPILPYHTYDPSVHPVPYPHFKNFESKRNKFPNHLQHVSPEDDPLATRTLFVGNLEVNTSNKELFHIFKPYGYIEDIDTKRPVLGTGNAFAFVRFQNVDMAHRAKVALSGHFIGQFPCKIGYGKPVPTPCVWVGGLAPWTSITQLERQFDRFGTIEKLEFVTGDEHAYILYDCIQSASEAISKMRGCTLEGCRHRLRLDFSGIPFRQRKSNTFEEYESSSPVTERSLSPCSIRSEETGLTLVKIASQCYTTWKGSFILKASRYPGNFYLIDGDIEVFDSLVKKEDGERQIKITQRVRLQPAKLESLKDKIERKVPYATALVLKDSKATEDGRVPIARNFNHLLKYLEEKQVAGIEIITNEKSERLGEVYSFPKCFLSEELLRKAYPNLSKEAMEEDHLVIVAVR